jgi:ArsR family transcriptional regulator, arsenate/arsenite/antimonite-responsive transcriptional repressor
MAYSKKHEFEDSENKISLFAKALSHPARIAILKKLASCNNCICGEIVDVMPLSQSTVSQHLKELKNCGIVRGEIEGPKSCYCIDWEKFEDELKEFSNLINELKELKNLNFININLSGAKNPEEEK